MSNANALWWLALPLLLLPVWWHRQKRQRSQTAPLATARFLPAAAPQQSRIWRWADPLLLALRLLLLAGVLAWLADAALPWRSDTVFVDARADPAWVEAQVQAAGWSAARRTVFCAEHIAPGPAASAPVCELHTADLLRWLVAHEREWRSSARLAVVATGPAVAMAAQAPLLAHSVALHLQPATPASAPIERHVVLASAREAAWRALFKAFESAGLARERFVIAPRPDARTELIVWDLPGAPAATWQAPLWWAVQPGAFAELAQARRSAGVRIADGARGRIWAQDDWPVDAADPLPGARAFFEDLQALQREPLPYAAPSMTLAATAAAPHPVPSGGAHPFLAPLLAALFALERLLAHRLRKSASPGSAGPAA
jgi:hypothetical protein